MCLSSRSTIRFDTFKRRALAMVDMHCNGDPTMAIVVHMLIIWAVSVIAMVMIGAATYMIQTLLNSPLTRELDINNWSDAFMFMVLGSESYMVTAALILRFFCMQKIEYTDNESNESEDDDSDIDVVSEDEGYGSAEQ